MQINILMKAQVIDLATSTECIMLYVPQCHNSYIVMSNLVGAVEAYAGHLVSSK